MQPQNTLKTRSHAAYRLHYHAVFVIKYRHKVITQSMSERLQDIFGSSTFRVEFLRRPVPVYAG